MKIVIREYNNKGKDVLLRTFPSKKAARAWIMEGMFACDGAEQEHYVYMFEQLEAGDNPIYYNEDWLTLWKELHQ